MAKSIRQEILGIAKNNGYEGDARTVKGAINALTDTLAGEDVADGKTVATALNKLAPFVGAGGGAAGYDVTITKEWLVAEQSVTTVRDEQSGTIHGTFTPSMDFKDAYDSGMRDAALVVNGASHNVTFYMNEIGDDTIACGLGDNDYDIAAIYEGGTLLHTAFTDYNAEEPTTYTVSCYHESVSGTTTPEFDYAVELAETAGKFVVTFSVSDGSIVTCDRSFEEIAQAAASRKPMAGVLVDGDLRYAGEAAASDTDYPRFVFAGPVDAIADNAVTDTLYVISAVIDEGSGEPTEWQLTESGSNVVYVNSTLGSGNNWALDMTPHQIYSAYHAGLVVVIDNPRDHNHPVFVENVTSLSRPSWSVESFVFERHSIGSNALKCETFEVYTDNGTPTMTLTETAYQLTPAS